VPVEPDLPQLAVAREVEGVAAAVDRVVGAVDHEVVAHAAAVLPALGPALVGVAQRHPLPPGPVGPGRVVEHVVQLALRAAEAAQAVVAARAAPGPAAGDEDG
ncbi:MAG: hypothetical protein ACK559_15105, partial [bacterium]